MRVFSIKFHFLWQVQYLAKFTKKSGAQKVEKHIVALEGHFVVWTHRLIALDISVFFFNAFLATLLRWQAWKNIGKTRKNIANTLANSGGKDFKTLQTHYIFDFKTCVHKNCPFSTFWRTRGRRIGRRKTKQKPTPCGTV